ncbi:MAG: hypothetical protein QXH59_08195 [Candidatus Caldarchaeum sp.]
MVSVDPASTLIENLPYLMIVGGSLAVSVFVAIKAVSTKNQEDSPGIRAPYPTNLGKVQNSQPVNPMPNVRFSEDVGKTIIDKLKSEQPENVQKPKTVEKFIDLDSLIASKEAFCSECGAQILHKGHVREVLLLGVFRYRLLYVCVKCGNPITPPVELKPNIDREGMMRLERFLEEIEVKKPEPAPVQEKQPTEQVQLTPAVLPNQPEQEKPRLQVEIKCGVCKFVKAEQVGNLTVYRCTGPGAPAIRRGKFLEKGLDTKACRWYAKYYRRGKVDELVSTSDIGESNEGI